jgi:ABC-type Fe3+/spermidine/putrescine transport system ATPase subunit
MTFVQINGLSKSYNGRQHAVQDIALAIPAGEITALLGPSGCGKTTLLKCIAGLLEPTSGDITFDGVSVLATPAEARSAVMVFQNHLLFPYMSVAENVGFGLKVRGLAKGVIAGRVSEMLALVKLAGYEKRRPHELSGGQQQRVALARALIVEPKVLLLDEPLSNLDAHLKDEMRELIWQVQRQLGITTVLVTHDQYTAVAIADWAALLWEGRLQQYGRPSDFYERPLTLQVARFFGGVNFLPATKQGTTLCTAWGEFTSPASPLPDGPVWLTIRPEQVRFTQNGATNRLPARILSRFYSGAHVRFKLQTATSTPLRLEAISHTPETHHLQPGDEVALVLPPEKIWLLPQTPVGPDKPLPHGEGHQDGHQVE